MGSNVLRCHLATTFEEDSVCTEVRHRVREGAWPWQVRAGSFSFSRVGSGPNFTFDLRNVHSFNFPFWYRKFLYKVVSLVADV